MTKLQPFAGLKTGELVMLAHALRMVPDNAMVLATNEIAWKGRGPIYIIGSPEFKAVWNALAKELNARPDGAEYGVTTPRRKAARKGAA